MTEFVLDASAILADLHGEPGGEFVRSNLSEGRVSAVNLAEVVTKLVDTGLSPEETETVVGKLSCVVEPADAARALAAGLLRGRTRKHGLSLGDRFCLALAAELGLPALTADQRWGELELGIPVELIR